LITSRDNERLKLVRKLESRRWRDKLGLFAVDGEDLVEAAAAAGFEPVDLLVAGEDVAPELLASVSTLAHAARAIGVYRASDLPRLEPSSNSLLLGLALWQVADPGNVGTLLRTADAFGAFVALSGGCADPTGPKAVRASMGAIFRVPVGAFEEAPGRRVALSARTGTPLHELELGAGTTFVLGAEREGLPAEVVSACNEVAHIPIDSESLNVAAAGAIALYEARRG
jgi:RNA methyltransferase, TrmH family